MADLRLDMHVRRVAGEARTGQAVLHDVQGRNHDAEQAGAVLFAAENTLRQGAGEDLLVFRVHVVAEDIESGDGLITLAGFGGLADHVGVEVDGNRHARAKGKARRNRNGIDQGAIDEKAIADLHRGEDAGQGEGGAHGVDQVTLAQPDFVPGCNVGGDGDKGVRKLFDRRVLEIILKDRDQAVAADEAGAAHAEIEIAENLAAVKGKGPFLKLGQFAGEVAAADQRADGGAGHDRGLNSVTGQGLEDADMGKTARQAAAEGESDGGRGGGGCIKSLLFFHDFSLYSCFRYRFKVNTLIMSDKSQQTTQEPTTPAMHAAPQHSLVLMRRLMGTYLRPFTAKLVFAVLLMIVSSALTAGFAKLMEPIMDDVLTARNASLVVPFGLAIFAIFTLNGVVTYAYTVMMNLIGQSVVASIQADLFSRFIGLDLKFFHDNPSGQLVSRVISDVNAVRAAVADSVIGIGKNFLTLALLIGLMFWQDWKLALIATCAFPLAGACVSKLGRKIRKISRGIQGEIGGLSDIMTQIFQGIRQVKAYGMEDHERQRAGAAIWRVRMLMFKGVRVGNMSTPVNEALLGAALMFVVMYGGGQVVAGNLTVGSLISFITAFALAYEPIRKLAKLNNNLQAGLGAADRIFEMMDLHPSITDKPGAMTLAVRQPSINFENVSFAYAADGVAALDGVSFTAEAGKVTALVGASGSGKTTAINLVPRFYDVTGGRVMIDGNDVRQLTLESLRRHVALVSQDITIFDDTVRANIAYGRVDASHAEIEEAARAAAADEFIRGLPEGYETRLGESGMKLSGGQRQRIAIARAMLRDAPVLLLDEATSALDNEAERAIQASLERLQRGRTTLVIAHRLSTVRNADRIVVLMGGKVAEQGRHEELIARGGVYARMHEMGLENAA